MILQLTYPDVIKNTDSVFKFDEIGHGAGWQGVSGNCCGSQKYGEQNLFIPCNCRFVKMELSRFPDSFIRKSSIAYPVVQDGFLENWTGHEAGVQVMVPAVMKKNRYLPSNEMSQYKGGS